MIIVNDSSCYSIGDEVLSGETAIKRMTVGIVTTIIDNKTLEIFKS